MSTVKCATIVNASSATNNLSLNADGSVTTGNALIMGSGSFKRNIVINGAMNIWQRGTSFSNPTAAGSFYTADRMGVNRAGDVAGATVSRSTSAPTGFQYSLDLQRTAAQTGTAGLYLYYSAETVDSIPLAGKNVTLSFYAKAGANYSGGSLSIVVNTGTGTDQRAYAYTGSSTVINETQAITTTWTRYSFTTSSAIASTITEIGFYIYWTPTGTAGADDAVYLTGLQLEEGSVATPFERQTYNEQLAQCQRYYSKTFPQATAPAQNAGLTGAFYYPQIGATGNASITSPSWLFPVTMRAATTVTIYNPSAANAQVRNTDGSVDCSATALKSSGVNGVSLSVTNNGSQGAAYAVHLTCDGEL